jgi:hypothetical protein
MSGISWCSAAVALACALVVGGWANAIERKALPEVAGLKVATVQAGTDGPVVQGDGTATARKATVPGCAKVKVVYAGYGEAARVACPTAGALE